MGQDPPRANQTLPANVGKQQATLKQPISPKTCNKKSNLPFTVCHWNCASGIINKLDDIKLTIIELKPSVIFISEADRKKHHDDNLIQINGYKLHNSQSLEKHGKSRIIAYTKDDCSLKRRLDLECPDTEMIIFDGPLNITSTVERIIGLYRPFTGPDGDKSSSGTWNRFVHLV